MSTRIGRRERALWIGLTSVLATSLAWMAAVSLAVLVHALTGHSAAVRAVARALGRIVWSGVGPAPLVLAVLVGVAVLMVLARVLGDGARAEREVRHV